MGEEKEKKKKKKKKEVAKEPTPPPEPKPEKKRRKKAPVKKRASAPKYSGALSIFNEKQLREFKDGFNFMDQDKDGMITKADLIRTYDIIGVRADDAELNDMVNEAPNPITFTQFLTLFAENMGGKVDDDDLITDSFAAFDEGDGSINPETFERTMKIDGEVLTDKECKMIFPELPRMGEGHTNPDFFSMKGIIGMLIAKREETPPPPPPPAAPAPAEAAPAEVPAEA